MSLSQKEKNPTDIESIDWFEENCILSVHNMTLMGVEREGKAVAVTFQCYRDSANSNIRLLTYYCCWL